MESLKKIIPKENLPADFGGTLPTLDQLHGNYIIFHLLPSLLLVLTSQFLIILPTGEKILPTVD